TRGDLFYYLPTTDSAVLAYDEAHKSVVSATQLGEGLGQTFTPAATNISQQVTIPVLMISGEFDGLACGPGPALDCSNTAAVQAFEAPYFTHAPSLTIKIVPNTGHDIALHTTAASSFNTINNWLNDQIENHQ